MLIEPPPSTILSLYESSNGIHLPASGTIRILVVLAEVNYDVGVDPTSCWPAGTFPSWGNTFLDVSAPSTGELTNYFSLASSGNHILLGDYLVADNNNGIFKVNNSDIIAATVLDQYYGNLDALVVAINNQMTHGFITKSGITDPAQFDNWTPTGPALAKVQSASKYDHVMVIWRNGAIPGGTGNASSSAIGNILGFDSDSFSQFGGQCGAPVDIARHEYSHLIIGGNNFHVSGGEEINMWIQKVSAHSILGLTTAALKCWSAWDRQRLGWKPSGNTFYISARNASNSAEVIADLDVTNPLHAGTYTLRDFATTGDAIRIKLPFIPLNKFQEYIWLENHNGRTMNNISFDEYTYQPGNTCITPAPYGLYAYMQVGKDINSDGTSSANLYGSYSDYVRYISADGFFDETLDIQTQPPGICWSVPARPFVKAIPNPLTGICDNDDIPIEITSPSDHLLDYHDRYPHNVENVLGTYNYNLFQAGNARQVFTLNGVKKFGLGTNPSTASQMNLASYNSAVNEPKNVRSVYLNGISIEILSQSGGNIQLQIKFDDVDVNSNTRFCGPSIVLNHINSPSGYSLNLKSGKVLTLDQGTTHTKMSNPIQYNGEEIFTTETVMSCTGNSSINLETNSELIVDNNSTLLFEPRSRIDIRSGAILRVKHGGKLFLQANGIINVENGGRVIVENDGSFYYAKDAIIKLNGSNSVLEIDGQLNIADDAIFTFSYSQNSSQHGYLLFANTSLFPSRNITAGNNSSISITGSSQNSTVLQINQETFYAPPSISNFTISHGKVKLNAGSRLQADGLSTKINFNNAKFTSNTPGNNNGHRGVHLYGQASVNIDNCVFEYGATGIYGFLTYGGAPLNILNTVFRNNTRGIQVYDKGCNLLNCYFYDNVLGSMGSYMSFPSVCSGSIYNGNTLGSYWLGYSTGKLTIDNPLINHNGTGVKVMSAPLTVKCGSVSYNDFGIQVQFGATLFMDKFVSPTTNEPADVTAIENNFTIRALAANYLNLNQGFNNLTPAAGHIQRAVSGSLLCGVPNPILASSNKWNLSGGFSANDYLLYDLCGNSLTISDPNPLSSIIACGQAIPSCPNPPCNNLKNALEYCPSCDVINTDDFVNKKLNEATTISLNMVKSTDPLNHRKAIELFYQILIEDFPNPDSKEFYLLNHNYIKLMESLGYAFLYNQITCDENRNGLCDELNKIIGVQEKLIGLAIQRNDYYRRFLYSMDKAQTYRIACRQELCLSFLNSMIAWVDESDKDQLNNFICSVNTELDVLEGRLDIASIEEKIASCDLTRQFKTRPSEIGERIINNPEVMISILPNPARNFTSLKTNIEHGKITLLDNLGRKVLIEKLNYDAELDLTSIPSGLYSLRIENFSTSEYNIKKLVVQ